ncbi:MAG: class I mannose-6-phosphate isomerase [Paludibacteraceae bacterium]|nr:class I mannose-6-phosphate isomerase [Paludibacteraceae bacterium]
MLYPLKFEPYYKSCIWGGNRLRDVLGKKCGGDVGESWEISVIEGKESVVSNGFLAGNTLKELVEVYMDDLVGGRVWERYHAEFPLLFKFIDSHDDLSFQVHPSDEMAKERHGGFGKTEMTYVVMAEENAKFYLGFREGISQDEIRKSVESGVLEQDVKAWNARRGDVFFVEAGTVHALGKGMLIAEVQESSDVTYRLYDYNRTDKDGKKRDLHVDEALESIRDKGVEMDEAKCVLHSREGEDSEIVKCEHFTVNRLWTEESRRVDLAQRGSFTVYMCVGGQGELIMPQTTMDKDKDEKVAVETEDVVSVRTGECVLIPAEVDELEIVSGGGALDLLEVYV